MHTQKKRLAAIVLLGGLAVLASYAYVLALDPATRAGLWGGVPQDLLPAYTLSMMLAAAGFFAFTYLLFVRVDPDRVRVAGRFGYSLFQVLYLLILIPSALWLPLTAAMVQQPGSLLWLGIRLVLALVGFGALALLSALLSLRPRQRGVAYWLAVAGAVAFCIQTAVLDLFVWTAYFPA
ncbi:MAG: hypothetical protein JXM73_13210 [Anaerolineae bacterium]|nr:hypothetical protein [Anaerolineae bacterium]